MVCRWWLLYSAVCISLQMLALVTAAVDGSCSRASRCCPGRDSSCVVQSSRGSCYCDEGCLETGDCCQDYKDVCSVRVVDCAVSSWSIWSPCDTSCGRGTQTRQRLITVHPSPSGAPCEPLRQKRRCLGNRCDINRYSAYKNAIRETAGLLPAKYMKKARSGRKWDVRENLFQHHKMMKLAMAKEKARQEDNFIDGYQADQPGRSDYCIVFELSRVTKACKRDKDFFNMRPGKRMCALCPVDARRENLGDRCKGHGVDAQLTRWRSTVSPKCHGKWTRVYETRHCPCQNGADVVFV